MTLNTCASMKLDVHFQRKQVSPGCSRQVRGWWCRRSCARWRGSVLVSCGTALGTEWLLEASAAKGVPSWFKGVNTLLCSPPGAVLVAVPL